MARCEDCLYHMVDEEKTMEKYQRYAKEKEMLLPNLHDGEVPVFCTWSYAVMGSKSVCADIEVADE